jgi:uncharacterized membrane protein YdfJ with MMPL/SSD domain
VIALAGMVIIGIPFLTVMGLAAAATVVVAVLVALTLLPALLAFAGARAGGGRHVGPGPTAGTRWVTLLTRLPWAAILGVNRRPGHHRAPRPRPAAGAARRPQPPGHEHRAQGL